MGWGYLPLEERRAKMREWRRANRERINAQKRAYYKTHRREHAAAYAASHRHRLSLTRRVYTRMNDSFQSRKLPPMKERDITVEGLLGCTYDDYERYLCRWPIWRPDNYDKDIDHIIPIRYYDLADPIDLKRVFNWRNTQVLTREQHSKKGKGLPPNAQLLQMKDLWPNSWWDASCDAEQVHALARSMKFKL